MEYGYCRISTGKQNIERQVRNILAAYPKARIIKEIYTGTKKTGRAALQRLLDRLKDGDTLIFDSVSRMSRSAEDGIRLYMELYQRGVKLVFLKEPHINTEVYQAAQQQSVEAVGHPIADIYIEATNRVLLLLAEEQIRLAFVQAEKEVQDLHQRTKEGIETARRNGKQVGQQAGRRLHIQKAEDAKVVIRQHAKAFGGTLSDAECLKLSGVSRGSYYKYKRELRAENE